MIILGGPPTNTVIIIPRPSSLLVRASDRQYQCPLLGTVQTLKRPRIVSASGGHLSFNIVTSSIRTNRKEEVELLDDDVLGDAAMIQWALRNHKILKHIFNPPLLYIGT
ncbi:hypothetical protein Ddc_08054 [Ditylenchus destructor]|nr:hypothetical protein Ddc_08054 [Ditylenchus destructor]